MSYKLILWNKVWWSLSCSKTIVTLAVRSFFTGSAFSYLTVISGCMSNGLLQPAIATGVTANLTSLQDSLSNLERVCNTPLPFAYQVHLRMSLWYVLSNILAWEIFLNTLTFLGYISFYCLCAMPSFCFSISFPYWSCLVPNIFRFWVCDHPSYCICCLPAPWFPRNWSRNVSGLHSSAYTAFF